MEPREVKKFLVDLSTVLALLGGCGAMFVIVIGWIWTGLQVLKTILSGW